MKIEIKAPAFPESVADGEVSLWHKQEGDFVQRDELLVEIETDKVVMEVVAPEAGRLDRILIDVGSTGFRHFGTSNRTEPASPRSRLAAVLNWG